METARFVRCPPLKTRGTIFTTSHLDTDFTKHTSNVPSSATAPGRYPHIATILGRIGRGGQKYPARVLEILALQVHHRIPVTEYLKEDGVEIGRCTGQEARHVSVRNILAHCAVEPESCDRREISAPYNSQVYLP